MLNIKIFSILPQLIENFSNTSILHRAMMDGHWKLNAIDIKQYGIGNYKHVDDTPYGGGNGMIMRSDVLDACLTNNIDFTQAHQKTIITSARGVQFNQKYAQNIAKEYNNLNIICNRFEGVDQRIIDHYNIEEVSIGNYILMGGEVAAMVIMESVVRLLPNVLPDQATAEESFSDKLSGMIEYDHYTRPKVWNNITVPSILSSGDHSAIAKWRENSAIKNTNKRKF